MFRKLLFCPILAFCIQAQVHIPQVGTIRCADGSVRPVLGIPASFVLGKPVVSNVFASSFSGTGGIVATPDSIQLLNAEGKPAGQFAAADPGALVNIGSDASSAIAWLPQSHSLLYWEGNSFRQVTLPAPPAGRVTDLRRDGPSASLLVFEDGAISENAVSLQSGNILSVSFLGAVAAPAVRQGEFVLFPSTAGLEIEGPQGRRSLAIAASNLSLERMNGEWIHIFSATSSRHWALHLTSRELQLFELPAAATPLEAAR